MFLNTVAFVNQSRNSQRISSQIGKALDGVARRTLDILSSFFGLLFLSPFFLLITILLHRDSPGPIFYHGPRIGKNGRKFGILKFRTMYETQASYEGPRVTGLLDDRITPFGSWLRDTKMNELPQLWNVLIGDMSLVGPRPEDPDIAAQWPQDIRAEILSVRPGMTSPASINYREEEKMLSSSNLMEDYLKKVLPSKLRLDVLYIRRRNLVNDLDVIFLTFIALLPQLRKKSIPQNILYNGPLNQFLSRFINWFFIDWMVSLIAVFFSGIAWRMSTPLNIGLWQSLIVALVIASIFSVCNLGMHLNCTSWRSARAEAAMDLGFSAGLASLVLILVNSLKWLPVHLPLGMLALTGALSFFGFVVVRYRERILTGMASRWFSIRRKTSALGERVLIVGAGDMGGLVSWLIKHGEFARVFSMIGYVDDDPDKTGLMMDGSPVLGMTVDLPALIAKHDIGLVIFAISNISPEQRRRILSICQRTAVQVVMFPDVMNLVRSSLQPEAGKPAEWIERRDVSHILDELDGLLEKGNLNDARARLVELQKQYAVQ